MYAYMARVVCSGCLVNTASASQYERMPELTSTAKTGYLNAYGMEPYTAFSDNTINGGIIPDEIPEDEIPTVHRMDHVAESVFWLLLTTLLRAQPTNIPDDPEGLRRLSYTWRMLGEHEIEEITFSDSCQGIFMHDRKIFERILHPGLKFLASMLREKMLQPRPEYTSFLIEAPPEEHLHETFQRIFLKYLAKMEDEVPLDVDNLRSVEDTDEAKRAKLAFDRCVQEPSQCDCEIQCFGKKRNCNWQQMNSGVESS